MNAYLIAEIGQNHNGNIEIAKKIVDSLKGSGVHAIKTAKRDIKSFPESWKTKPYDNKNSFGETYFEHRCALELSNYDFKEFARYVQKSGFDFISSYTDVASLDFLVNKVRPSYYKIASSRVKDYALLKATAEHNLPVILSTGMSDISDVYYAKKILNPLVIMQCTSSYPCEVEDLNLSVIEDFKVKFPDTPIGFSNHYPNVSACSFSYIMGASFIEFHYTLDRNMRGTDHQLSFVKDNVDLLVKSICDIDIMMGSSIKRIQPCEQKAIDKLRSDL